MAYMSQEHKAEIAAVVKPILKKYGIKGSLAVRHHSTLVLNIKSGDIDFIHNYNLTVRKQATEAGNRYCPVTGSFRVNHFHYDNHFSGKALAFLKELVPALYGPRYFDKSDSQTDYFHCSHYVEINIGKWNTPYIAK